MHFVARIVSVGSLMLAVCLGGGAVWANEKGAIVHRSIDAPYEDVLFELNEALTKQGLVKNMTAHVADMLNRTEADVGATRTVYKNGDVIEFCSATLSRAAMEADPNNMAFCPYTMFVYETVANPGKVVVGYRRLTGGATQASRNALEGVNRLLDEMLQDVVDAF